MQALDIILSKSESNSSAGMVDIDPSTRYRPLQNLISSFSFSYSTSINLVDLVASISTSRRRYRPLLCRNALFPFLLDSYVSDVLDVEVFSRFRPLQKTSSSFSALLNSSIFILFSAKSHGNSCKPIYLTFKHKLH